MKKSLNDFNRSQKNIRFENPSMKSKSLLFFCTTALASTSLHAANIYWDGTGTWGGVVGWSTAAGAATPNPSAIPTVADIAIFNISTLTTNQTISLAADRSVQGIQFGGTTGTKTLQGGGTDQTLTLGISGITVAAASGAVTVGSVTAGQNVAINLINSQSWTNNSTANTLTIANGVTRSAGAAVVFAGAGTITAANAFANNSAGIVGTWATFGTGTSAKYATKNGSNILTAVTGTAAASGADLTDTTGLVNYELATAAGAVPTTFSANTIRYTGTADTLAPGATSFTLNGLLNAGTGELTIGTNNVTIGADKELVINAASAPVTISSIIADNGSGASSLTKTGGSNLTLTGTNLYTGGTYITGGAITLANSSGNAIQGPITLGGNARLLLGGSDQIADTSVITFASGANSARFQLTNAAGVGYNETIGGIADAAGSISGSRLVESATDGASNSPATLTINTAGSNYAFGGLVRDAAGGATNSALSIVKDGLGTQTFSGNVSYSGSTTVKAGILKIAGVVNNSAISLEGGTIEFTSGGTRSLAITSTSSSGGVTKSGTGTLIFTGDNTYTGNTIITNGTLQLNRAGGTIADTGTISVNNDTAILDVAQDDSIGTLNLASGATVSGVGTLTVSTAITPNIAINKTNNISASLAGAAYLKKTGQGTTILSAANSYSGGTILSGANSKLTISGAGTLGSTSGALSIETASAILDLGGTSQTVGSVSAVGTVSNGTLNVSTQLSLGDPLTSNAIGSASFDSLTMGSASTYSFGLQSGTLLADLGNITGALNIASGSILDLVQLGTFAAGEKFTLFGYTSGNLTGLFTDTGSNLLTDGATFSDAGGSWIIDYNDTTAGLNGGLGNTFITITAVPEPGAALLGGLGLICLLRRRREA